MRRVLILSATLLALGGCVMEPNYVAAPQGYWARPSSPPPARYVPGPWGPQVGHGYTRPGYAQQSPYPFGHVTRTPDPVETMATGN